MAEQDFYKTLSVARGASTKEIRRAYKKLAREFHPDAKPDDPSAAEKFKEIQEAYSVLNDSKKRSQYDRFGSSFRGAGRGPFPGGPGGPGPIDLGDLLGGGGIDFGNLFGGGFGGGGGGGGGPGTQRRSPAQKGEDVHLEIDVPFQIAAEGGNHSLTLNRGGDTERINVKIPAGVNTGSVIRLAGQGQSGFGGGPAGDLKLTVNVAPHPWFRRDGSNLLVDVPITPTEAALGAKVEVPTLTEGRLNLTIPAGTSSGTRLRMRGKGVIDLKTGNQGDQYAIVKIVVPPRLSAEETELYRNLDDISPCTPRDGLW